MARKTRTRAAESQDTDNARQTGARFTRVIVIIVALEHYRKPSVGDPLPTVAYANADADAFAAVLKEIVNDLPSEDLVVEIIRDGDASLTALRDHLAYTIKNLAADDLFIFYYAGHGFHGAGGNRLSTYDTNRSNVGGTTLLMRDDLLERLADSECQQALVFVDACADKFREAIESRDVISNLDADEVEAFLDSGWYSASSFPARPAKSRIPRSASVTVCGPTSCWKRCQGTPTGP